MFSHVGFDLWAWPYGLAALMEAPSCLPHHEGARGALFTQLPLKVSQERALQGLARAHVLSVATEVGAVIEGGGPFQQEEGLLFWLENLQQSPRANLHSTNYLFPKMPPLAVKHCLLVHPQK